MAEHARKPISRDEAVRRLKALEPSARALGIVSLYLFGSTARDEAQANSDIDVFVDLDPRMKLGFAFFGLGDILEAGVGRPVDFTTRAGLHDLMRDRIEREAVQVF